MEILSEFEKLLSKINEVGIKSFDEKTIELCNNRIIDKQNIFNNSVVDKLKLCLRINQQMYETEAKIFLKQFKEKEVVYRNEISATIKTIADHVRFVEEERQAKILRQQKLT